MKITKALAQKVDDVVCAGLTRGAGNPIPGQMCVEAAVCFALGEPHGDKPSCVGAAVRAFKIGLNDANWSSNEARARGMRVLAVAQLGSDTINQREFAECITRDVIQQILPNVLREIGLEKEALACEKAKTLQEASAASYAASAASDAASYAASDAASYAASAASDAASDAASAASYAASDAASYAASDAASYAASDAASAASYAASDAASAASHDALLSQAANLAVQVLRDLKSPGVEWLGIIPASAA